MEPLAPGCRRRLVKQGEKSSGSPAVLRAVVNGPLPGQCGCRSERRQIARGAGLCTDGGLGCDGARRSGGRTAGVQFQTKPEIALI